MDNLHFFNIFEVSTPFSEIHSKTSECHYKTISGMDGKHYDVKRISVAEHELFLSARQVLFIRFIKRNFRLVTLLNCTFLQMQLLSKFESKIEFLRHSSS